jgi:predicted transcriptional regulator
MTKRKSIFDNIDKEIEARAIAEAEAEIDAGLGVPHRQWLMKLARGKFKQPPTVL